MITVPSGVKMIARGNYGNAGDTTCGPSEVPIASVPSEYLNVAADGWARSNVSGIIYFQ